MKLRGLDLQTNADVYDVPKHAIVLEAKLILHDYSRGIRPCTATKTFEECFSKTCSVHSAPKLGLW